MAFSQGWLKRCSVVSTLRMDVGTVIEKRLYDSLVASTRGRSTVRVEVGILIGKQLHGSLVASSRGHMKRRPLASNSRMDVGAVIKMQLCDSLMAF